MVKRGNCDQDAIADAMIRDVSVCCKNKVKSSISQKRKRYTSASESEDESEGSSTSLQRNRKKKTSRKIVENSNSDTESIDSERSKSKTKRPQKTKPIDSVPKKVQSKVNILPKSKNNVKVPTNVVLPSLVESTVVESSSECNDIQNIPSTDIDSTPDLFAFLVNHGIEQTTGSNLTITPEQPSSSTSSPLVIQSVVGSQPKSIPAQPKRTGPFVRRPASQMPQSTPMSGNSTPQTPQSTTISGNSVFHNYNGYRIDLQSAAKQSTIRLPNGKIIHVKKHTPLSRSDSPSTIPHAPTQTVRVPAPQSVRPQICQPAQSIRPLVAQRNRVPVPRREGPSGPGPQLMAQRPRPYIRPSILQTPTQPPYTIQNSGPNNMYALPFQASTGQVYPANQVQMNSNQMQMNNVNTPQSNQNPVVSAPRTYTNDKIGRARTQLEQQIFNAISICHQIDGKLKTLMNSNAYKNANKLNDIKELYIHLSYLFTYTNGRFKTVQEKCMDDMRRLGFKSFANSLSSGNVIDKYGSDADEDELEIVEPSHQTINLDSDDETSPQKKSSEAPKTVSIEKSVASQPSIQPISDSQHLTQPSSINNSNASGGEEATMPHEIDISTEQLECDVDIMALLQPQIMFDEDENIESLLTRMDEEIEIGTPPLSEETDTGIDKINDLKLKSKLTIRLNRVEKEFPEIFKKLKEIDKSTETENGQPLEADSSDNNVPIIGETDSDDRLTSNLAQHIEGISSSLNEDNIDDVLPSKEADNLGEEKNQVDGDQIDSNVDGCEILKEADNSAEAENQVDGEQIDTSNKMIPEIKDQSATASIEISAQNEPGTEGKSSVTETSQELEVPVDKINDTIDENSTKDDAHSSVKIATIDDSDALSNKEKSMENDIEIILKSNEERIAESIQPYDDKATASKSGNEVNEENACGNDTVESNQLFDESNGDFDNISSPDTFDEMAQNGKTDDLGFANAFDILN